jgi:uncharacterized protein
MSNFAAALPAASMAANLHALLPITLATAAFSALFQLALTTLVIRQRVRAGISLLDGGDASLTRRIRAHANFTETMPMALLLLLLLELAGWRATWLTGCALLLVAGRLLHAVGILRPSSGPARRVGMICTLTALLALALGVVGMLFGAG